MRKIPFSGRLDVTLACLLVVERHGSVANRAVRRDEIGGDVMSLVTCLEISPECLRDEDTFAFEVDRALLALLGAGWIAERAERGSAAFVKAEVADEVIRWIRCRLLHDQRAVAAFDRFDRAVTERVLADYGAALPSRRA